MKRQVRYVSLPPELDRRFRAFCAATRRDEPFTIRAIVECFLADGDAVADRRLSRGVWNTAPPAESTAALEHDIAQAVQQAAPGRKKKSG